MSFNPQVIGIGENKFVGNSLYFATAEEALAYAADLQSRWMGCKGGPDNRRAAPDDHPVNSSYAHGRLVMFKTGSAP